MREIHKTMTTALEDLENSRFYDCVKKLLDITVPKCSAEDMRLFKQRYNAVIMTVSNRINCYCPIEGMTERQWEDFYKLEDRYDNNFH